MPTSVCPHTRQNEHGWASPWCCEGKHDKRLERVFRLGVSQFSIDVVGVERDQVVRLDDSLVA